MLFRSSPCPTSGLVIHGKKDELVPFDDINELNKRLSEQKGIKVEFEAIQDANHFFSKNESSLAKFLNKYIKKYKDKPNDERLKIIIEDILNTGHIQKDDLTIVVIDSKN